jgi:site-specific DNA-methyltransferase (adenine-specific)
VFLEVHFDTANGYGYIRKFENGAHETVRKLGQVEGGTAKIHKPHTETALAETKLASLPRDSIDLIITDPPYGASTRVGRSQFNGQHKMGAERAGRVNNHENLDFLDGIPPAFERVLKSDSHLYVFCNQESYAEMREYFGSVFDMSQLIVWEKPNYGVGDSQTYSPVHEFIMHFRYGSPELRYGDDRKRPKNLLTFKRASVTSEEVKHSTQKPIRLIDELIELSSDTGDLVLDPFSGSHVVGRAAQHTFRRSICSDMDPQEVAKGDMLVDKQLRDDPVYDVDWTDITNINVTETTPPTTQADVAESEVTADD